MYFTMLELKWSAMSRLAPSTTAWNNLATRKTQGLSLNPNTTNPQKNLANRLCGAPLAEKRQAVVWHDLINSFINSHRTNDLRACTAQNLTEILKLLTKINAIVYCQRNGTPDIRNQLISSGFFFHSYYEVSHFEEEE